MKILFKAIFVVFATLCALWLLATAIKPVATSVLPAPPEQETKLQKAYRLTSVQPSNVQISTSIMTADFTLTNNSDYDVKDLEIECDHTGESGTVMDSNTRTIYKVVPAHQKIKVRRFNMGFANSQTVKTYCKVQHLALSGELN